MIRTQVLFPEGFTATLNHESYLEALESLKASAKMGGLHTVIVDKNGIFLTAEKFLEKCKIELASSHA